MSYTTSKLQCNDTLQYFSEMNYFLFVAVGDIHQDDNYQKKAKYKILPFENVLHNKDRKDKRF